MASKSKNIQIIVTSKGLKEVKRDLVSIRKLTGPGKNNNIKINLSVNQKFFQTSLQKAFKNIATKKLNLSINQAFFNKSLATAIAQAERRGIRLTANVVGTGRARPEQKRAERIAGGSGTSNIVGGVAFQRQATAATIAGTKAQQEGNALVNKNVTANKIVAESGKKMSNATVASAKATHSANKQLQNLNRAISLLNKNVGRLIDSMLQVELSMKQAASNSKTPKGIRSIRRTQAQIGKAAQRAENRRNLAAQTALEPYDPYSSNSKLKANKEAYDLRKRLSAAQALGASETQLANGQMVNTRKAIKATHEARNKRTDDGKRADPLEVNKAQIRAVRKLTISANALKKSQDIQKREYDKSKPPQHPKVTPLKKLRTPPFIGSGTGGRDGGRGSRGGRGGTGGSGGGRGPYTQQRGIIGTKGGGGDFSHMASGMGGFVGMYAEVAAKTFALGAAFRALKEAANFGVLIDGMKAYEAASGASLLAVARRVQEITQHTIGLKEASQGVTMSIAAGFDSSQIEAMAIAAKNAGMALGRDLGDAFDRITKGVTKAEPELLDELGIILRLETASKKYAKTLVNLDGSIGKNVKELTTYEKQQAVLAEVVDQATTKFGLLGSAMEGKANSLAAISAALTDTALKAGNFALDFKILGIASLKDVVKFFSENSTAVIAAFAGLSMFLLKNMMPTMSKFTTKYAESATAFADSSHAMSRAAKNSGTSVRSWAQDMKVQTPFAAMVATMDSMGVGVASAEGSIINSFDKIGTAYKNVLDTGLTGDFTAEMDKLKEAAGEDFAETLIPKDASKEKLGELLATQDDFQGGPRVDRVQQKISKRLLKQVQSQIKQMGADNQVVGKFQDEALGIDAQVTRRGLQDLEQQMKRSLDPDNYDKQLEKLGKDTGRKVASGVQKGIKKGVAGFNKVMGTKFTGDALRHPFQTLERSVTESASRRAQVQSLKAQGQSNVQLSRQHDGMVAGWKEARVQASRYGKEVDKVYRKAGKSLGLWGTAAKRMGQAQIMFGSQVKSAGASIMSGGMKAMQAVAIYTMLEAAIKGVARAFGITGKHVGKAIAAAEAFGEELESQQDKWQGYVNQLGLFTDSLDGIGKAAAHEAGSLITFTSSLDNMSAKWQVAIDNMKIGDEWGEAFSEMTFWSDSMAESMEKQTKELAETIQSSGHLQAIADSLEIDTSNLVLFDDKGRITGEMSKFIEKAKTAARHSKNLENGIKDLAQAYKELGTSTTEFAKGLITSTKFDDLVSDAKALENSFEKILVDPKGLASLEETMKKAVAASIAFKENMGGISLDVDTVRSAARLRHYSGGQMGRNSETKKANNLIYQELMQDPRMQAALNVKVPGDRLIAKQRALGSINRDEQTKVLGSRLEDSLLPKMRSTIFKNIPEKQWEDIAKAIIKQAQEGIASATAKFSKDGMFKAGTFKVLDKDIESIIKGAMDKHLPPELVDQQIRQGIIQSQVDDMGIALSSSIQTLLKDEGRTEFKLKTLGENIKMGPDGDWDFQDRVDFLSEGIKLYQEHVKEAQHQSRYLAGEINLMTAAMDRLKSTTVSTDLFESLKTKNKIIDANKSIVQLEIKHLRLQEQSEDRDEAILQQQRKLADLERGRLSDSLILLQSMTAEFEKQEGLWNTRVGLLEGEAKALGSIGALNKSQLANIAFTSDRYKAISRSVIETLKLETELTQKRVNTQDLVALNSEYDKKKQLVLDTMTSTVKIAQMEKDTKYLEHRLELYTRQVEKVSELYTIQQSFNGLIEQAGVVGEASIAKKTYASTLATEALEATKQLTELKAAFELAFKFDPDSTTAGSMNATAYSKQLKIYEAEKEHLQSISKHKAEIARITRDTALNALEESKTIESISGYIDAQIGLNDARLTSSVHIYNVSARQNKLESLKLKYDKQAELHLHRVSKIHDKLHSGELETWEKKNLIFDLNTEILNQEKERVELLNDYVDTLKEEHEARKRAGSASLDDELYYRLKELRDAMPSAVDRAADAMLGSINNAIDLMAANYKEGKSPFGDEGFEDFAAKQWIYAGETLIDNAAASMKAHSAEILLGSDYKTPEQVAQSQLDEATTTNTILFDIRNVLDRTRRKQVTLSNDAGTSATASAAQAVKENKNFSDMNPDDQSAMIHKLYTENQSYWKDTAENTGKLVKLFTDLADDKIATKAFNAAEREQDSFNAQWDAMEHRLNTSPSWLGGTNNLMSNEDRAFESNFDATEKAQDSFNAQWDAMEHRLNTSPSWLGEPTNNLMSNKERAAAVAADKAIVDKEYLDLAMFQAEFDQEQMEALANIERFIGSLGYSMDRVISLGNKGKTATEVITNYTDKLGGGNAEDTKFKEHERYNNNLAELKQFLHGAVNEEMGSGFMGFNPMKTMAHSMLTSEMGQYNDPSTVNSGMLANTRAMMADKMAGEISPDKIAYILDRFDRFAAQFDNYKAAVDNYTEKLLAPTVVIPSIPLENPKYNALPGASDLNHNPNWQDRDDNNRGAEFYAHGGHVSGAGGPTDDSVAAWLSNGEFVVNADATKRNRAFLNIINEGGKIPGFSEGTRPDSYLGRGIYDAVDPQVTRVLREVAGHVLTISTLLKDQVGYSVRAIDDLSRELVFDLVSVIEFELGIPMGEFMSFISTEMSPTLDKLNVTLDTINKGFTDAADTYDKVTTPSEWIPGDWFSPNGDDMSHDKFAAGGWVSGPGGPKEDKIPAMLSNGEYVINAASTKKHEPLIRAINDDTLNLAAGGRADKDKYAKFAEGGYWSGDVTSEQSLTTTGIGNDYKQTFLKMITTKTEGQELLDLLMMFSRDSASGNSTLDTLFKMDISQAEVDSLLYHFKALTDSGTMGAFSGSMGSWGGISSGFAEGGFAKFAEGGPVPPWLQNINKGVIDDKIAQIAAKMSVNETLANDKIMRSMSGTRNISLGRGTVPNAGFQQWNNPGTLQNRNFPHGGRPYGWEKGSLQLTSEQRMARDYFKKGWPANSYGSNMPTQHLDIGSNADRAKQMRLAKGNSMWKKIYSGASKAGGRAIFGPLGLGVGLAELISMFMEEEPRSVMEGYFDGGLISDLLFGKRAEANPVVMKFLTWGGNLLGKTGGNQIGNLGSRTPGLFGKPTTKSLFTRNRGKGSPYDWVTRLPGEGGKAYSKRVSDFSGKINEPWRVKLENKIWRMESGGKEVIPRFDKFGNRQYALGGKVDGRISQDAWPMTDPWFGSPERMEEGDAIDWIKDKKKDLFEDGVYGNLSGNKLKKAIGWKNPYWLGQDKIDFAKLLTKSGNTSRGYMGSTGNQSTSDKIRRESKALYFSEGGLSKKGRGRDNMLAHVNEQEATLLQAMGGSGIINPRTGLREFEAGNDNPFSNIVDAITKQTDDFLEGSKDNFEGLKDFFSDLSKDEADKADKREKLKKYKKDAPYIPQGTNIDGYIDRLRSENERNIEDQLAQSEQERQWREFDNSEGAKKFADTFGMKASSVLKLGGDYLQAAIGQAFITGKFDLKGMVGGFAANLSSIFMNKAAGMATDWIMGGLTGWLGGLGGGGGSLGFGSTANGISNNMMVSEYAAGGVAKQGYARFSHGGAIHGAGGPTSDSIPAWLSNGEYVINAASTSRYRPIIEAINADELANGGFAKFARGGFPEYTKYAAGGISDTMTPGPDMAAIKPIPQGSMGKTEVSNNVSVNVNVTNGGASVNVESDSDNELTQEQSKALGLMIGQKIQEQLLDEQRPGGILSEY